MRARYERYTTLGDVLRRVRELSAQTIVFDVEPLVVYWDGGQEALDRGLAMVVSQLGLVPGVRVVCFATNSARRPSVLPSSAGTQVTYLASARKPLATAAYRGYPRPGVVVGDQIVTDGILARRLGYVFVQYRPPPGQTPAGPRLLRRFGRLMRPALFRRRHAVRHRDTTAPAVTDIYPERLPRVRHRAVRAGDFGSLVAARGLSSHSPSEPMLRLLLKSEQILVARVGTTTLRLNVAGLPPRRGRTS